MFVFTKRITFAMDTASPVGRVKSNFIDNGRLRTFSSAFKLRNFETISEGTATRRPRRVKYTLSGLLL